MAEVRLTDRPTNQSLNLRAIRLNSLARNGKKLVLVRAVRAADHVARKNVAALISDVGACAVPNAANNKDCVTLLHLACRAERTVSGPGEGTLGPFVRSDNDLSGPILKRAFL